MTSYSAQVVPGSTDWLSRRVFGDMSARLSTENNQQMMEPMTDSPPSSAYHADYKYPILINVKQDPDEINDYYNVHRRHVSTEMVPTFECAPRRTLLGNEFDQPRRVSSGYLDNGLTEFESRGLPTVGDLIQQQNDVIMSRDHNTARRRLAADEPVDLSLIEQTSVSGIGSLGSRSWNGPHNRQYGGDYHVSSEQHHVTLSQRHVHNEKDYREIQRYEPPNVGAPDSELKDKQHHQRRKMLYANEQRYRKRGGDDVEQIQTVITEHHQSPPVLPSRAGSGDQNADHDRVTAGTAAEMFNFERRQTWPLDTPVLPSWRRRLHQLDGFTQSDNLAGASQDDHLSSESFQMVGNGRSPISELIQLYDVTLASRDHSQQTGNSTQQLTDDVDMTSPTHRYNSESQMDEEGGSYNAETKKYSCHICPYVGDDKNAFDAHMKIHFDHWCPSCNYSSRTEGRLRCHIKMFHSKAEGQASNDNSKKRQKSKITCRHCDYTTRVKEELWLHMRQHITPEKMLECPRCTFVTDLKHHLEYHLRSSHIGSKPYKCDKCTYRCFNQSMLNSHAKSHTNVYQFRCRDCTFAAKYCHALKVHIRRYGHEAAPVLNEDGSQPTDGSGDFALISRRGRPRGPRGHTDMPRFRSVRNRHQGNSANNQNDVRQSTSGDPGLFPEVADKMYFHNVAQLAVSRLNEDKFSETTATGVLPSFAKFTAGAAGGVGPLFPCENGMMSSTSRKPMFPDIHNDMSPAQYPPHLSQQRLNDSHYIDDYRHQGVPDELSSSYMNDYVTQSRPSSLVAQPSAPLPSFVFHYPAGNMPSPVLEPEQAQCGDLPLDLTLTTKPKYDNSHLRNVDDDVMDDLDCQRPVDYEQVFRRRRDFRNWSKMQPERKSLVGDDVPEQSAQWVQQFVQSFSPQSSLVDVPDKAASSAGGSPASSSRHEKAESPSRDDEIVSRDHGSPSSWVASGRYQCTHCEIDFHGSRTLHAMHMAYHSNDDPFQCNVCGERTNDRVTFFMHLARVAHN